MSDALLATLEAFEIDDGPVNLPFAARLAREHGWDRRFATRVVAEYKRFAYLAATAGYPVTPSQAVDHCWHLHLCYTRSYWERFCPLLPAPLHHTPTAGGPSERRRYHDQYQRTLAAYRAAFGHEPPADIWPPPAVRFGTDLQEVTVNTAAHWVVPKAAARRLAASLSVVGLAVVGGIGCGVPDPFELKGTQFLGVYIPALLAALMAGLVLRNWAKNRPPADPPADWEPVGLLTGGPQRLTAAAITRLAERGVVGLNDSETTLMATGPLPPDVGSAERAVYAALPISQTDRVRLLKLVKEVGAAAADTRDRLDATGLTLTAGAAKRAGFLSVVPLLAVLLLLGLPRLVAGVTNDKPMGYLVITSLIAAGVTAVVWGCRPYRTSAGDRAKAALGGHSPGPDRALTVAALGTAALAGTELARLHAWYPRQAATGDGGFLMTGGDGGGGDGGGGGGCGGGCGGCGGGD